MYKKLLLVIVVAGLLTGCESPAVKATDVGKNYTVSNFSKTGNLSDLTLFDIYVEDFDSKLIKYYEYLDRGGVYAGEMEFYVLDPAVNEFVRWYPSDEDIEFIKKSSGQ